MRTSCWGKMMVASLWTPLPDEPMAAVESKVTVGTV